MCLQIEAIGKLHSNLLHHFVLPLEGSILNASKRQNAEQLAAIESLRGCAALMVLTYHLAKLMKLPVPASIGFIHTHFWLGVPLFYTISGFVLAYGYADRICEGGRPGVLAFYARRLFRIAPLFYFMMGLWLVASWLVSGKTFSAQTLLLNVFFLYGLVPGEHESIVWAGWSIGVEMLFYLVFPIIVLLFRGVKSTLVAFLLTCVLSAAVFNALQDAKLTSYANMNLGTQLPFFIAGMACYRVWQAIRFVRHVQAGWVLFVLTLLAAVLLASDRFVIALEQWQLLAAQRNVWAVLFGTLILSVCLASNPLLECGLLRHFGKLSFSVYLVHPMAMAVLIKVGFVEWLLALGYGSGLAFALGAAVAGAAVLVASCISFRFVETPGIALGRYVAGQVQVGSSQGQSPRMF